MQVQLCLLSNSYELSHSGTWILLHDTCTDKNHNCVHVRIHSSLLAPWLLTGVSSWSFQKRPSIIIISLTLVLQWKKYCTRRLAVFLMSISPALQRESASSTWLVNQTIIMHLSAMNIGVWFCLLNKTCCLRPSIG